MLITYSIYYSILFDICQVPFYISIFIPFNSTPSSARTRIYLTPSITLASTRSPQPALTFMVTSGVLMLMCFASAIFFGLISADSPNFSSKLF